jgi:hypothetical protein
MARKGDAHETEGCLKASRRVNERNGDVTTGIGSERVSGADMCPALFENSLFPGKP